MTTWTSSVVVGLVDPRRQVRALSRELERNGVAIRAIVPEVSILRGLLADGALGAVIIGGPGRRLPGEIARLRELSEVPVVVCGDSPAREELLDALRAGASGFVVAAPRCGVGEELAQAVHAVAGGGIWVSPRVARHLVREVLDSTAGRSFGPLASEGTVTRRERQVLELVATGLTYRAIGERLCISCSTVKTHAHSALRTLGLRNRIEVVRWISQQDAA